jgi:nucleoside-diphosphate-sugar epimerase
MALHTIFGATGVIGRELAVALAAAGERVRLVSRRPRVNASVETVAADLLDAEATARAVAGSAVAYLVAGLPYDASIWEQQWPRVMRHAIDACKRHGVRLVFFDNVYAYGLVQGPMTEDTPFNPRSRKGEVRARIATLLLDEMRGGNLTALIARSADFYGPDAVNSFPHATVFERLRAGKTPQWIGDATKVHSFTFTPDAGKAVAVLGRSEQAYGQAWHVPTSAEALTGEGFVRLACELAGRQYRIQVAPPWLLQAMSLFNRTLRENTEMMYQFDHDYHFDSRKIETELGLTATPYRRGIAATLT